MVVVQWLSLCASTEGAVSLIPNGGTKILHASWRGQKIKQQQNKQMWWWGDG